MGCCASAPLDKDGLPRAHDGGNQQNDTSGKSELQSAKQNLPDFGTLTQLYVPIRLLGRGGCGDTYLMEEKKSGRRVAVKVIDRPIPKKMVLRIETEIVVQALLGAQSTAIVEAYDAILTDKHLALSMELAAGGSLTDYVTSKFRTTKKPGLFVTEPEACYFFRQFIDAVDVCHATHIAHRDLKLDNTLLTDDDPPHIKLADFGFAKSWGAGGNEEANMHTILGTPEYMSPEQARISTQHSDTDYNAAHSDIWSSGVVLFVMLFGFFPFEVEVDAENPGFERQLQQVWGQQLNDVWWKSRHIAVVWDLISEDCQDLIKRLFEYDEGKRISMEEVKRHPWYCQKLPTKYEEALKNVKKKQAEAVRKGSKDPLKMRHRAERLKLIVQAAASLPESAEAAEILGQQPKPDNENETWYKDDAGRHLVTRVSLVRKSFMSFDNGLHSEIGNGSVEVIMEDGESSERSGSIR
mmetsp:Transcript_8420/g.24143  ORF Transcript_8420/g.24143 Transcript_8420/m.24143 type:complete len:466 (-) Transcript_8420:426-1823(-)|eukprot:CAMPEP_0117665750 /NCGR_PEP_ID=MMETSP0804-20121206/9988_1 /TAXON_ID=1074897 /ORGANISM="Tetraselmis astigmatica, Strain CCMP880" /LENGTH=465 /DNA_ID=CAMNT_0005473207 /DNA_START=285 /DNA_END=1682 /DNA_ORIENTATION=+